MQRRIITSLACTAVLGVLLIARLGASGSFPGSPQTVSPLAEFPTTARPPAADSVKGESVEHPRAVLQKGKVDFGEVVGGTKVTAAFQLKNTGAGPLEIVATPDCGCTVVRYDRIIAAGREATIETELDTNRLNGPINKAVIIETNDAEHTRLVLTISGKVVPAVDIVPQGTALVALNLDEPTMHTFRLRPRVSDSVEITSVVCNQPFAHAHMQAAATDKTAREYLLTITFDADAPFGASTVVTTLTTTSKLQPEMTIIARCEKGILLSSTDLRMKLPVSEEGDAAGFLLLRKREGAFQILNAAASDPNLTVRVDPVKQGTLYRLHATSNAGAKLLRKSIITVETDDQHQPTLEIPVHTPSTSIVRNR